MGAVTSVTSLCEEVLSTDSDPKYEHLEPGGASGPQRPAGPRLALRVVYAVLEEGPGARGSPFAMGDEIGILQVERVKAWDALAYCEEARARPKGHWPAGTRQDFPQASYGARTIASDGKGGMEEHYCLLQVCRDPAHRTHEAARLAVDDAGLAAAYARKFNSHVATTMGRDVDASDVPGIKVCLPVACEVIGTAVPDLAQKGEVLVLTAYPAKEVHKFVFDGSEQFHELPQSFFHFVSWASGGREVVADLQGTQDEDGFLLVSPTVIRPPQFGITDLLGVATGVGQGSPSPEELRFNAWHPKCGPLCRSFDAQRAGAKAAKRHCGLSAPACGVGA